MTPEIAFRPVTRAGYPLLRGWLAQSHVRAVWGPPEHEIALIDAGVDGGDTAMLIVHLAGRPIGYIQDWCPHRARAPHLRDTPSGTRAVDCLLGAADLLGQGVARRFVRARAEALRAAGFVPLAERIAEDGMPALCMTFSPSSWHQYSGGSGGRRPPARC